MAENSLAQNSPSTADTTTAEEDLSIECAVCLQPCVYPVQLPCKHIFCFLCVKGVTTQSKRCAMCRREIPPNYLENPELLSKVDLQMEGGRGFEEGGEYWQWFYEGRNGWWVYDERTSQEVEMHFKNGDQRCELLIAGFLYIIDFEHMLQYRRNDPSRRRRVKRDVATGPKKGVAGLRIEQEVVEAEAVAVDASTDAAVATQGSADSGGSAVTVDGGIVDAIASLDINADTQTTSQTGRTNQEEDTRQVSQGETTGNVRSGARPTSTPVNTGNTARPGPAMSGNSADQIQTLAEDTDDDDDEQAGGEERWQHLMPSGQGGRK